MTDETITPIIKPETNTEPPKGRRADLFAAGLAGLGTCLSLIAAVWFFLGFAENDTRPEHLASAFILTLILFAFAIGPFACVSFIARAAYRSGPKRAYLLWTLLLMLPWVGLGAIAVSHTPLPMWCGLVIAILAALLSLWALVSLSLDRVAKPVNTSSSQQNEMPDTSE